ncbi:nuclear transport factor 2 family protein [Labilibacter marinus]|uniref:nuclear transport factor 2 family protein n=1 Tax=Labilibacter marinus TaxID=1477105 RepID=UPI000834A24F|nr:nuclear transport factor 2 family protein [Labilibacter marinus]
MKLLSTIILFIGLSTITACAQKTSSATEKLLALDASWEKAQLEMDFVYLESLLAEDFIWVHNHAGTVDNKKAVIERAKRHLKNKNNNTKARTSSDVKVIVLQETAIVTGYTTVDRGPKPTKYHFMRTYVKVGAKYLLLANHTMAIPKE